MADQVITPVKVTGEDAFKALSAANYASLTAANDGVLTPPKDGSFILHFIVTDAAGATITVKAGTGVLHSQGDLSSGALAKNDECILVLQSSRFKVLSGTDRGDIRIDVNGAVSCACLQLIP